MALLWTGTGYKYIGPKPKDEKEEKKTKKKDEKPASPYVLKSPSSKSKNLTKKRMQELQKIAIQTTGERDGPKAVKKITGGAERYTDLENRVYSFGLTAQMVESDDFDDWEE